MKTEGYIQFTKSELEMIYKYAATTKEDTVKAMKETLPATEIGIGVFHVERLH